MCDPSNNYAIQDTRSTEVAIAAILARSQIGIPGRPGYSGYSIDIITVVNATNCGSIGLVDLHIYCEKRKQMYMFCFK